MIDSPQQIEWSRRLVVFTGDLSHSVRKGIVELDRALPGLTWLVVWQRPHRSIARLLRSQWRNLRRNGWRWIPYQFLDLWGRFAAAPRPAPDSAPGRDWRLESLVARSNVRVVQVDDLHARTVREEIEAFHPQLGLSLAAPILQRAVFAAPRLGTINLHKGRLPDFRGMPPAFWELWNDATSVGCTVHWVDDKLDTGAVVARAAVECGRFTTLRGIQLQLDEVGIALMTRAATDILAGQAASVAQSPGGRTYRKPTLKQVSQLQRQLARRQPRQPQHARRLVRDAAAKGLWLLWQGGVRALLPARITVLLYHRVSDDSRCNLTVGIEKFERQMALLRRYCEPISIEAALAAETIPRSRAPLVAVNFDDGYLDNFQHAAPILMRHGIPAAFFVSTGMIGTTRRFPHDVRRGNEAIATMQWGHLRKMRDWGFTIGSHSVTHIDCAAEPRDVVQAELAQSRDDLHRELGVTNPMFAYPYGGRHQMTAERLEFVKQAGYSACLAAYGGSNVGRIDRFNVLRKGIHWGFSDQAFLFECLGLR